MSLDYNEYIVKCSTFFIWKLGEWIASLMKTGNCSISSLTIASLLKLGLRDDRRPSMHHFFLVDLVELDRQVYPHPCRHFTFQTLQGGWYKYVPLKTSTFVAILYFISCRCNASFSKTPGCFLANLLSAVLVTCSRALFSGLECAFCLCAVFATCSFALLFSGFVHAICLHAVSATCSCALFSGFVCEFVSVPYRQLAPVFCSHGLCVQFVSVPYWQLAPVFCRQDSDVFLAELQHSFSGDYVLTLHRV